MWHLTGIDGDITYGYAAIIGVIMVPIALSLRSIDLKAPAHGH